jgi:hypothetical protein
MTTLLELDELANPADRIVGPIAREGATGVHDTLAPHAPRPARSSGPLGTVQPCGRAVRHRSIARYVAPARFDVHAVEDFDGWVAASTRAGVRSLVVELSNVEFVDVAAIDAIAAARDHTHVELVDLSLAALVTFRLIGSAVEPSLDVEMAVAA